MKDLSLENGYKIKDISKIGRDNVKSLCEKCTDYFILHYGTTPSYEEINEIFDSFPPGKTYEDKYILGIYRSDALTGIIDIVKDYPTVGEWALGLMLIVPEERGRGLGKKAHKALAEWAKTLGSESFRIGVVEDNKRGIAFWSSLGYKKIKEVNADIKGKPHTVNIMRLEL